MITESQHLFSYMYEKKKMIYIEQKQKTSTLDVEVRLSKLLDEVFWTLLAQQLGASSPQEPVVDSPRCNYFVIITHPSNMSDGAVFRFLSTAVWKVIVFFQEGLFLFVFC